ncbi:MAG: DEAD/DEAH box helicase [Nitrososphaerota archaeon]|nr:DEAD/DEAH box helicase [Nitrososphaerota archaeon]
MLGANGIGLDSFPDLLPFQREGVEYALDRRRSINGDSPGCGKTMQGIAWASVTGRWPVVVGCPAHLKWNWRREVMKWAPWDAEAAHVVGDKKAPIPMDEAKWVVCSHRMLGKALPLLKARAASVVFDESHCFKAARSQQSKAAKDLAWGVWDRLLLTGTAYKNRPFELLHQLVILGRLKEFGGWQRYVEHYCAGEKKWRWVKGAKREYWDTDGHSNLDELYRELTRICYIRRRLEDVVDQFPAKMPPARVEVPLSNYAEYDRTDGGFMEQVRREMFSGEWVAEAERLPDGERADAYQERWDKFWRVQNAEAIAKGARLRKLAGVGKVKAVVEWARNLMEETGEKLVVFAWHREVVDAIAEAFEGSAKVSGGMPAAAKQAEVDRFQEDGACRIIVGSLKAMGEGYTLTAARHVAFAELHFVPADMDDQGVGRLWRYGQDREVFPWWLVAGGTVDTEWILPMLESKAEVCAAGLDGVAKPEVAELWTP